MAELADATVLGAVGSPVQVQVLLSAVSDKGRKYRVALVNRYISGLLSAFFIV